MEELELLKNTFPQSPDKLFEGIILPLLIAAALGLIVRAVYGITATKGRELNRDIYNAIPVLSMIITLVIIAIGGSLVHAVSLLGTLALIRFRTKVKTVHDMSYIFLVVAVGISSGLKMYIVGAVGTLVVLFISGILYAYDHKKNHAAE